MADARLIPPGINDTTSQAISGLLDRFDGLDLDKLVMIPVETRLDAVLEHLAWAYHVDGWEYVSTRAQKIDLIKRFYEFHRYKGTKYGLALYLRTFLNRDLLACSPPTKSFCGASLTDAERSAWEANFPELRVYPYRHTGKRQGAFVGDYCGVMYPNTSDAILRIGDQVTLYDPVDGSEIKLDSLVTDRDVVTKTATQRVTVRLPSTAGLAMFVGRYPGAYYTCDTGASSRMYVLDLSVGYEDEVARRYTMSVRPSLTPVKIGCETVASAGTRGNGIFLGHRWPDAYAEAAALFIEGKFPVKSSSGDRLYRMTKLFDANRIVYNRRDTSTFLGAFKLGAVRPHYAEAAVDMLRNAPVRAMFCGRPVYMRCTCDLDAQVWIDRMCRVGRLAVRLSDRILVSTANRKCIQASESLKCGSVVCGEYQLEAF
jgi:hypothetical protein